MLFCPLDRCVGVSDQLQLLGKEQERNKLLCSSAPPDTAPATPKTPLTSKSTAKENTRTPAAKKIQKAAGGGNTDAEEAGLTSGDGEVAMADKGLDGEGGEARGKTGGKKSSVKTKLAQPEIPNVQPAPAECEYSLNICTDIT